MLKKNKENIKNWFYYIALIGFLLIVVINPLGKITIRLNALKPLEKFQEYAPVISRLGSWIMIFGVFGSFVWSLIFDENPIESIFVLSMFCAIIIPQILMGKGSYGSIVDLMHFLELPVLLFCFRNKSRKGVLTKTFFVFLFISVYYFALSFTRSMYTGFWEKTKRLILGFENVNQTGIQLLSVMLVLLCATSYFKNWLYKIAYFTMSIIMLYLINETTCRTCLVVGAVAIVLFVFHKFFKPNKIVCLVAYLFPIIFALFIMYGENIYSSWEFMGDAFDSGRKDIYVKVFKKLTVPTAFFGKFLARGVTNDHNAFISIFANVGLIGGGMYLTYFLNKLFTTSDNLKFNHQRVALTGILLLLLYSSTESGVFVNGSYTTFPLLVLYLLANTEDDRMLKPSWKDRDKLIRWFDSDRIIFVSEVCASPKKTTSTHILTSTLLDGFKELNKQVIFVAICSEIEKPLVYEQYKDKVSKIIFVKKRCSTRAGKYKRLFQFYKNSIFGLPLERKSKKEILSNIGKGDVLIAHTPSIESVLLCKKIKKYYESVTFIQYWSDPLAIAGILPEQVNFKRLPFIILENYLFSLSNDIVFGTKILMQAQQKIYKNHAYKMRYADLPFVDKPIEVEERTDSEFRILYSGNYYSKIRNIEPLVEAVESIGDEKVILNVYGNGDVDLSNKKGVVKHERVSPEEIHRIQCLSDVSVCILNSGCVQIPGKIFHDAGINNHVLVITDGKYKEEIKSYLAELDRFTFCDNNAADIQKALTGLIGKKSFISETAINRLCPKNVAKVVLN